MLGYVLHKTLRSAADEVTSAGSLQSLEDDLTVLRPEILEQSSLHRLFLRCFRHIYLFHSIGIKLGIEHRCGDSSGRRVEVLNLLGTYLVVPEEEREVYRLIQRTSGMRGHKVRHEILLLSHTLGYLVEALLERLVSLDMRLAHFIENGCRAVFRSDLELTADVELYELAYELVILVLHKVVVTNSRAYENALDALNRAYFPEHCKVLGVVGFQSRTGCRRKALLAHTQSLGELFFAGGMAEIRSRSAHIVYIALEIRHFRDPLSLRKNRLLAADGDSPALMQSYRAEVAVAEAAAVVGYREANLLYAGNSALCIV